jgi:ribosomal protein S18 acetylase RimI-like enzyme
VTSLDPDHRSLAHLLREAPLQHVVTLKMLHSVGPATKFRLLEDRDGWALVSLIPTGAFEYDRQTYPDRDFVVLVDGTSVGGKLELLAELPPGALVIKTYDQIVKDYFERHRSARLARSFISFTASESTSRAPQNSSVSEGIAPRPDITRLFAANGYLESEIARSFADGARWFAIERGGQPRSVGFVFRNFESVWEIGGILTEPAFRRQGFARQIVAAALRHLGEQGCIPRYQVRADNTASIQLAKAVGLRQFLQIDHLLVDPVR